MDNYHREIIITNIDTLIEWTDYSKLKAGFIDTNILSIETVQEIEKTSDNPKAKHVALLQKFTESRRCDSFTVLIKICQTNFWDAADFLASFKKCDGAGVDGLCTAFEYQCNSSDPVSVERDGNYLGKLRRSSIEHISLQLYDGPVGEMFNVTKAVRFCQGNLLAYPMRSINRGVFFLVNIIEVQNQPRLYRNGAIVDKERLICLFKQFGFEIFYYENLTLKQFRQLVDELIKSRILRKTDSLVFCVLSHGCFKDGHQMIQFSDGKNGSIEDVIVKFSNRNCPFLRKKPKLFIFPMCRGISSKIKVKTFDSPTHDSPTVDNIPPFSDIKICYGSVKGFETFRDQTVGSWYIQVFCEILATYAYNEHFDDLHKLIGQRLEHYCQTRSNGNEQFVQTISSEDLGFTQHLFFNPGYFGEN